MALEAGWQPLLGRALESGWQPLLGRALEALWQLPLGSVLDAPGQVGQGLPLLHSPVVGDSGLCCGELWEVVGRCHVPV